MKIGFIGLGQMGSAMAASLLQAGHALTVYNRTRSAADPLEKAGAQVASSPAEAARQADAVITMLSNDEAVEAVTLGKEGLIERLGKEAVHVSMSTISPNLSKQLADAHAQAGQAYLAAPVFGRPDVAEKGNLWTVVGGEKDKIERCQPIWDAVSKRGFSAVGAEPWKANVVKITGNFTIAAMMETLGEAFALMQKSGIDPKDFLQIANQALFKSPLYENYGGQIVEKRFDPALATLDLGLKDMRLVLQAADQVGAPMPLVSLIHDQMLSLSAQGQGDRDWSIVAQASAKNAGLE